MLFGSESFRPATWYPQPALHSATLINTNTIRRLMALISPPASPHSTPAIGYYPPLPKRTIASQHPCQPPDTQAESHFHQRRSRCLGLDPPSAARQNRPASTLQQLV